VAPVLRAEVPPCAPAGEADGGTASQLIRSVGRTWGTVAPSEGAMIPLAVLILMGASAVPPEQAAMPGVKAVGIYPLFLPGLHAVPAGRPRVLLWCSGVKLLGVMVPDEPRQKTGTGAQSRSLPSAILLRDGRCEADGSVSFGFLVPVKAWIFDGAVRTPPEERTTWLLHRFQGTVSDRLLKGALVQADVSHPGFAFREAKVEVGTLVEDQASFADENGWLEDVARTFSLVHAEP